MSSYNAYDFLASLSEADRAAYHAREAVEVEKIRAEAAAARVKREAERARAEERARGPASLRGMMAGGSDLPLSLRDMAVKDD